MNDDLESCPLYRAACATTQRRGERVRLRLALSLIVVSGFLTGCQMGVDPATGQTQTMWTLPGTQANAIAARQAWQQCTMFASESYCEQTLPNGRPPGTPIGLPNHDQTP